MLPGGAMKRFVLLLVLALTILYADYRIICAEPLTREPGILTDKLLNLTFNHQTVQNKPSDDLYPAWAPNGESIAFTSNRSGKYEIWLMKVDGSDCRRLTAFKGAGSVAMSPAWYPNSLSIVFSAKNDAKSTFDIWRINIDGGGLRNLTYFLNESDEKDPSWSPDGSRIVFASNRGAEGQYKLYTIDSRSFDTNVQDANITLLPDQVGNNYHPVWSPNGTSIAFVSDRAGKRNIWMMPFPGSKAVKLTNGQDDAFPSWSLDGRVIYYSSREGNTTSVCSIPVTGGSPTTLINWDGYNTFDPECSRKPELNRILFVSNRDGNNDIWLSSVRDTNPPYLTRLPVVSPRQARPGDKVVITAKVEDRHSGVGKVYAQIKNADKFIYKDQTEKLISEGSASSAGDGGGGAPDGGAGGGGDTPAIKVRVHTDYEIVDTIELFDDGKHNDGLAGDGIYANAISTKGGEGEYYINIVVKDKAGNTKAYDNITGFTTKIFVPSSKILLVNDYMCGQRFDAVRYGGSYNRPGWLMNPAESYFKKSWSYESNAGTIKWSGYAWSKGWWLEGAGGSTGIMRRGTEPRDPFYGESYDEWRIICRGPIDTATLLTYSNSDKCVIWGSPYAGNLWTDAGTIEDPEAQDTLMKFLDYGGRLMVTGQDVAWALTKDGKVYNKFLTAYMKVRYIADQAGKWTLTPAKGSIADLPGQGDVDGSGGIFVVRDKADEAKPAEGDDNAAGGGGGLQLKLAGYYYGTKDSGPDPDYWAGDACKNQWWNDVVMPEAPAEAILTYSSQSSADDGGDSGSAGNTDNAGALPDFAGAEPAKPKLISNAAGICYWNTQKNYKTIFLAFGFESIRPGFESFQDPETKNAAAGGGGGGEAASTEYAVMNNRARLMGSFITWLRTGRVTGTVTDGVKPINNAVIEVYLGSNDTKPVYKTTTLSDGSYTIMGIDSGSYAYIRAKYPGYYDHAIGCIITGGRTANVDFRLSTVTRGLIYGRVMMASNDVTPISRALIEVIWTNPVTKEESVIKAAYTEFDGRYMIGDLRGAQYKVRASAQGMVTKVIDKVMVKDEGRTMVNFKLGDR
jgi:Tol biopolymer transport system component